MLPINNLVDALPADFLESGFSLSLWGETPKTGYMVSYERLEAVFQNPTITDVTDYVQENALYLYLLPHAFVGGWFDSKSGLYYLDISQNIQDRNEALHVAAERKQLAIFDLSTFESIYL